MKPSRHLLVLSALAVSLSGGWVFAQEGGEESAGEDSDAGLELTMRMLPANAEVPDAATRDLVLPTRIDEVTGEAVPIPSEQGQLHGGLGLERANEARQNVLGNAAENGREIGEAAAEAAQNNREELGRGTRPDLNDLRPEQVPVDVPGPPEIPGRP